MKCDELEELSGGYYFKEDVDEAIAELKDVIRKYEANAWMPLPQPPKEAKE